MITYLINQAILVVFNLVNVKIDAFRMTKHKKIAHGINLAAYGIFIGLLIWLFKMNWPSGFLFVVSALANRQLSFDIPLNLKRGKQWYYQSTADTPAAFWDRIEKELFGTANGKKIAAIYAGIWLVCLTIKLIF